jgi:hypothetical protein
MTQPRHTTPRPDAARRKAPPALTYSLAEVDC